jgi:hypothetical protein
MRLESAGDIEFWVVFFIENSVKYKKIILQGKKFSWVTSSHLVQFKCKTIQKERDKSMGGYLQSNVEKVSQIASSECKGNLNW